MPSKLFNFFFFLIIIKKIKKSENISCGLCEVSKERKEKDTMADNLNFHHQPALLGLYCCFWKLGELHYAPMLMGFVKGGTPGWISFLALLLT